MTRPACCSHRGLHVAPSFSRHDAGCPHRSLRARRGALRMLSGRRAFRPTAPSEDHGGGSPKDPAPLSRGDSRVAPAHHRAASSKRPCDALPERARTLFSRSRPGRAEHAFICGRTAGASRGPPSRARGFVLPSCALSGGLNASVAASRVGRVVTLRPGPPEPVPRRVHVFGPRLNTSLSPDGTLLRLFLAPDAQSSAAVRQTGGTRSRSRPDESELHPEGQSDPVRPAHRGMTNVTTRHLPIAHSAARRPRVLPTHAAVRTRSTTGSLGCA